MSGVVGNSTIRSRVVSVKSRPLDARGHGPHRFPSYVSRSCRPDVLSKMPRSCNVVFDLLRSAGDPRGQVVVSVRYLSGVSRLSSRTVRRALRRLTGAHLIALLAVGRGTRASTWQLCWSSVFCTFQHARGALSPIRSRTRDSKAFSPKGTETRPKDQPGQRALRWAAAQVRRELASGFTADPTKGRAIVTGVQAALWRAVAAGSVRPGPHLGRVVRGVLCRLHEAHERAPAMRPWSAWAGWAVKLAVDEDRQDQAEHLATQRLVAAIRREKEEARGGLETFLNEAGCSSLRDCIHQGAKAEESSVLAAPGPSLYSSRREGASSKDVRWSEGSPRRDEKWPNRYLRCSQGPCASSGSVAGKRAVIVHAASFTDRTTTASGEKVGSCGRSTCAARTSKE
jgi:hypothetical protein